MTGLDSNILVRYFTQDDPAQAKRANHLIERAVNAHEYLFINHIVLCEVCWVLAKAYGYPRAVVSQILEKILATKQFEIEEKQLAWQALADFQVSQADYADCLIGVKNRRWGCDVTHTFDKEAATLSTFKRL